MSKRIMSSKRYAQLSGRECPVCGMLLAEAVDKGAPERIPHHQGGYMQGWSRRLVTCSFCKSTWDEESAIVQYTNLKQGDKIGKEKCKTKAKM